MKRKIVLAITAFFLLLLIIVVGCKPSEKKETSYVVMLSMDGFRWDYPDQYETPNLDSIALHGVKAVSLKPCFPTKTFPNHYSMATGLYPDHHGIVQNSFYDAAMDKYYAIGNQEAMENPEFYSGEPIWVTAEQQGIKTASLFWVGSETKIAGFQPSYWKKYEEELPFEQRIDTIISWLQLPEEERPHLIMWYFHEPDDIGHELGPDAMETGIEVHYLDSLVGVFTKKINHLSIADKINLIFTSDHGMENISDERNIVISDYIPSDWVVNIEGSNPSYNLDIKTEFEDEAYKILSKVDHIKIWKHGELPERLHYGNNPRTLDFTLVSDSSWSLNWDTRKFNYKGTHGYDNDNKDMHAIFYAIGPAFKMDFTQPTFENVEIYGLISKILDLKPAKTDGKLKDVIQMLRN